MIVCHWPKTRMTSIGPQVTATVDKILPTFSIMIQLLVGCITTSTIPPQDAVLAIEGLVAANEKFNFFTADWFRSQFLGIALEAVIRALLLGFIPGHADALDGLLKKLCVDANDSVWAAFKDLVCKHFI